jgi:hypothetical protein
VEYRFSTRADGQVDAAVAGDHAVLNDALADSISSLPPRGASGDGPSTYWIEVAREGVLTAHASASQVPFIWGNTTLFRVRGDEVEARYDYDDEGTPGETIALADFVALLDEWRARVLDSAKTATAPLPETYRRNPVKAPP